MDAWYSDRTMSDEYVTSEPPDYNFSSNITTNTDGGLTQHFSTRNAIIVRVAILLIMAIFNLCGNGFTLITIRLTPRLDQQGQIIHRPSLKVGLDLAGGRPGAQLNLDLTKTMINNARQLSRSLV